MAAQPKNESHWQKVARLLGNDISSTAGTAKDIVGRGVVAPIMGLPVDMFNLGARRPEHKGSSEFFGEQMEDAGVVSPDRNPKSELLASLLNPASFAAKVAAVPALAATFAGKGAKTADLFKLRKAEEMLKKGASDRDAYAQTGWTHGFADKKPRFEIDDTGSKGNFTHEMKYGNNRQWDKAIDHPTLYDEYPELNKYTQLGLRQNEMAGSLQESHIIGGQFGEKGELVPNLLTAKGLDDNAIRSVGLHELQHGVQHKEGFGRGGSPNFFRKKMLAANDYNNQVRKQLRSYKDEIIKLEHSGESPERLAELRGRVIDYRDVIRKEQVRIDAINPYESYRKLAGEAEARLTQARKDMTAAERAKSYPPDMFDVPVEDQIVRFDGSKKKPTKWQY